MEQTTCDKVGKGLVVGYVQTFFHSVCMASAIADCASIIERI